MSERPSVSDLQPILDTVKRSFAGKKRQDISNEEFEQNPEVAIAAMTPTIDAVDMLFTDFKSSVVQLVSLQRLLPAAFTEDWGSDQLGVAIFEPSPQDVLDSVADRFVDIQLWQAYLESQASEQSARMMAMKTASDNAGELIDDLTLAMNTARQASITQELAEITGGAEAIA
jgi:F-type H+-transporting ATPase subunit gamma